MEKDTGGQGCFNSKRHLGRCGGGVASREALLLPFTRQTFFRALHVSWVTAASSWDTYWGLATVTVGTASSSPGHFRPHPHPHPHLGPGQLRTQGPTWALSVAGDPLQALFPEEREPRHLTSRAPNPVRGSAVSSSLCGTGEKCWRTQGSRGGKHPSLDVTEWSGCEAAGSGFSWFVLLTFSFETISHLPPPPIALIIEAESQLISSNWKGDWRSYIENTPLRDANCFPFTKSGYVY